MLAVFSSDVVRAPEELIRAGNQTPTPKKSASKLVSAFLEQFPSGVAMSIGMSANIAYTHDNQSHLKPRLFGVKAGVFCLFEGALENLTALKQQYGLSKDATEVNVVMEAYRALRDRAPYSTHHMLGHLVGSFAFVVYDQANSAAFIACGEDGRIPLYLGITADGYLAFSGDAEILRRACGKSLASFPPGCFFSTSTGELRSYEHPKNRVTAIPATEEEIWGATFKIERPHLQPATIRPN